MTAPKPPGMPTIGELSHIDFSNFPPPSWWWWHRWWDPVPDWVFKDEALVKRFYAVEAEFANKALQVEKDRIQVEQDKLTQMQKLIAGGVR